MYDVTMNFDIYATRTIRDGDHTWWTGSGTKDGYAKYNATYVHRWIVEQDTDIPDDWEVDHTCSVVHPTYGKCVAREHLEPVSKTENMRRHGERVQVCRNGHPYTPGNTYRNPTTGRKACRICKTANTRRFFDENPGYHAEWRRRRKEGDLTP